MEELESLLFPLEVLEQGDLGAHELDKLAVVDDMADTVDMRDLYTVGMLQGVDIDKAVGNVQGVERDGNCRVVDGDKRELVQPGKRAHGVLLDLDGDLRGDETARDVGVVVVDIEDD